LLRSAILTNRQILDQLQSAEAQTSECSSDSDAQIKPDEMCARSLFEVEIEQACVSISQNALVSSTDNLTWEKVLLQSYAELSKNPPASLTLVSTIPTPKSGSQKEDVKGSASGTDRFHNYNTNPEPGQGSCQDTDEQVAALLEEWTDTPRSAIDLALAEQKRTSAFALPGAPRWASDE